MINREPVTANMMDPKVQREALLMAVILVAHVKSCFICTRLLYCSGHTETRKQIMFLWRCTWADYLTWFIAPRCWWDQRPVMNIQMRCSICVGEIIGKLQKHAGFSLKPGWNHVKCRTEWLAEIPILKLKWDLLPALLKKKNLSQPVGIISCWQNPVSAE